ncbi:hypothetical protein ALC57_15436 [Trachymyrmex cornetzi]|uniref:Uncharacterized protein n=1 Tax=Trachymyrmex cornetzi TaxID=471704 RepID=A0A151IX45_9HYME|nr:hypothetical protein ALC57_15436 [Trachymyrmex cornetzi]
MNEDSDEEVLPDDTGFASEYDTDRVEKFIPSPEIHAPNSRTKHCMILYRRDLKTVKKTWKITSEWNANCWSSAARSLLWSRLTINSNHIESRRFLEDTREIVLERVQDAIERHGSMKVKTAFNGELATNNKRVIKSINTKNIEIYRSPICASGTSGMSSSPHWHRLKSSRNATAGGHCHVEFYYQREQTKSHIEWRAGCHI